MPYDPITGKRLPYPGEPGYSPQGSGVGGQFTSEENEIMREMMPAIMQQESEAARAEALADELRAGAEGGQGKRMDWASQASRALKGIGSGLQYQAGKEGFEGALGQRGTLAGRFAKIPGGGRPVIPGQLEMEVDEEGNLRNRHYG